MSRWYRGQTVTVALPFCHWTLTAPKPTAYPKELRTVGDHLKKRRLDLGLFQKDVALQLGVNESTILNWENNTCAPAIRMLPRIIDFLGYDPYLAPQSLGEQLLAKRRHLGLSRKRMAAKLAVDAGTLAAWESGKRRLTGKRLHIVEKFLASPSSTV